MYSELKMVGIMVLIINKNAHYTFLFIYHIT